MGEIVIDNDRIAKRLNEDTTEEVNGMLTSEEITVTPSELEPVYNQVGELKGATVKKTRNRVQKATISVSKVNSVADSIEKMKEKIELLQYVDGVIVPEIILERNNKAGRELLIALQKEVDGIKSKYVEKIQKL